MVLRLMLSVAILLPCRLTYGADKPDLGKYGSKRLAGVMLERKANVASINAQREESLGLLRKYDTIQIIIQSLTDKGVVVDELRSRAWIQFQEQDAEVAESLKRFQNKNNYGDDLEKVHSFLTKNQQYMTDLLLHLLCFDRQ